MNYKIYSDIILLFKKQQKIYNKKESLSKKSVHFDKLKEVKMANDKKEDVNADKIYGYLCKTSKDEFISEFNVKEEGLTDEEVEQKVSKYGHNEVTQSKPKKWYHYLLRSLFTPFNSILIGIALILCYTDVYLAEAPSYANIIVILVLVTVSTFLDFFSEYRSNKACLLYTSPSPRDNV